MLVLTSVQATVQTALLEQKLSQSEAARRCGVHRNFIIDLLHGKVPTVKEDRPFVDKGLRYTNVAAGLGLDVSAFLALVQQGQPPKIRADHTPTSIGVERTSSGGVAVSLSRALLEFGNFSLAFTLEGDRLSVTLASPTKT